MMQRLLDELVVFAHEDWVYLANVANCVRDLFPDCDDAERTRITVDVVLTLLSDRLWIAGNPGRTGFKSWDLAPEACVRRIDAEWRSLEHRLRIGEICMFANTQRGHERARALIANGFKSALDVEDAD
jgi:hypothetical protein